MATTQYSDILPYILPEVQGCSDPLAEQAIRDAVIEFCAKSRIWIEICDPEDVFAREAFYDIDVPAGASLVQVKQVQVGGAVLAPSASRSSDTGTPKTFAQVNDDQIILSPVPDSAVHDGLLIELIIKPSRDSDGFPGWINERYQDAIVAGAKARLMKKMGTAWHNPGLAAAYEQEFHTGWSTAAQDAAESLVGAVLRTTTYN